MCRPYKHSLLREQTTIVTFHLWFKHYKNDKRKKLAASTRSAFVSVSPSTTLLFPTTATLQPTIRNEWCTSNWNASQKSIHSSRIKSLILTRYYSLHSIAGLTLSSPRRLATVHSPFDSLLSNLKSSSRTRPKPSKRYSNTWD